MELKTFDMETVSFYMLNTRFDKLCFMLQLVNENILNIEKNFDTYTEYQQAMAKNDLYSNNKRKNELLKELELIK